MIDALLTDPGAALMALAALGALAVVVGIAGVVMARVRSRARRGSSATLEASASGEVQPASAPTRAERSAQPLPATLGRYRIDAELGRGAMGTLYLGHDPRTQRAVAVKTMALGREFDATDLAEARTRFFREAEAAARLRHRDIVDVYEAGEDRGLAFIAMEYVQGHDLLRHTLPGHLLPVPVVLRTMARVALALAYAHTQGVVHRDVKPANVMIDPATDTVKVADFGIARITDSFRTRTGLVLGTPSFMSPEQMAGRRVDGRSDLYSLGVMLFQMLTGALPHRAEGMGELLRQIAHETAPDVRTLRPELPEALAHVLTLALEKRPELRYADGMQLASDLMATADRLDPPSGHESGPTTPGAAGSRVDPRHNAGH